MTVNHYLPYLGDDAAPYEAALLDLFQKYPPSSASDVSITIHKAGKAGCDYTSRYPPLGTKSIHEFAELWLTRSCESISPTWGRSLKASHWISSAAAYWEDRG
jgi:hypothetical protein